MNSIDKKRAEIIKEQGFSDEDIRMDYDFGIFARRYLSHTGGSVKDMEIDDIVRSQYVQHAEARATIAPLNPVLKIARFFTEGEHLSKMKDMFVTDNYQKFRYRAFRYNCILPFVASKTVRVRTFPGDGRSESFLNLNVCSNKSDSFIVFGWIEDGGIVKNYLDTLTLNDGNKIVNNVLGYLFKNPTNTFFRESWWNSLSDETRHIVLSYHENEIHALPEKLQLNEDYKIFIPEFPPTNRFDG
jgi:hypothetical protein